MGSRIAINNVNLDSDEYRLLFVSISSDIDRIKSVLSSCDENDYTLYFDDQLSRLKLLSLKIFGFCYE